jgi:hypothetical protein
VVVESIEGAAIAAGIKTGRQSKCLFWNRQAKLRNG